MVKTSKLNKLKRRSEDALNIFKSTSLTLLQINKEIDKECENIENQLKTLKSNKNILEEQSFNNTKIINKLSEFIQG